MAASTRTLDSERPRRPSLVTRAAREPGDPGPRPPDAPQPRTFDARQAITRAGLAGFSLLALVAFAIYAAYLAAQAEDITAPTPITVPSRGATTPFGRGERAPDFTLADLDGKPVSLSAFSGRPVWINIWASWCAPCRAEMPDIDAVYAEQRARQPDGDGLALLVVSIGEDPAVVRRYVQTAGYHLPVLVDPTFAITERYRITGLPTHYFIGRDGVIQDFVIGGLKPNAMRARLARIL